MKEENFKQRTKSTELCGFVLFIRDGRDASDRTTRSVDEVLGQGLGLGFGCFGCCSCRLAFVAV